MVQPEAVRARAEDPQTLHGTGKPRLSTRVSTPNPKYSQCAHNTAPEQVPRAGDLSHSPSFNPISAPSIPISLASAARTQKLWVFLLS